MHLSSSKRWMKIVLDRLIRHCSDNKWHCLHKTKHRRCYCRFLLRNNVARHHRPPTPHYAAQHIVTLCTYVVSANFGWFECHLTICLSANLGVDISVRYYCKTPHNRCPTASDKTSVWKFPAATQELFDTYLIDGGSAGLQFGIVPAALQTAVWHCIKLI